VVASSNPAARLHAIFTRYAGEYHVEKTLESIWKSALGAGNPAATRQHLADVVGLIGDVRRQLQALDRPAYLEMFDDVSPRLLGTMVLNPQTQNNVVGTYLQVSETQLKVLATLSGILEDANLGLARVEDETRETIRAAIADALRAVRAEDELPVDVKRAIIARLHDILWALDHLETGGPEAAVAAAERLGFLWSRNEQHQTSAFKTAMQAAGTAWAAFLFSAESVQAIETFQQLFQLSR
jgi:hypothetical protein